eukprot:GHRQ01018178.1.p1 GENE.GHRQ01018178.1~~GHRQ01018178.1.p1  ORF type:complete len:160 (+),score=16.65 GHRQ01018178.1:673-1152(+)
MYSCSHRRPQPCPRCSCNSSSSSSSSSGGGGGSSSMTVLCMNLAATWQDHMQSASMHARLPPRTDNNNGLRPSGELMAMHTHTYYIFRARHIIAPTIRTYLPHLVAQRHLQHKPCLLQQLALAHPPLLIGASRQRPSSQSLPIQSRLTTLCWLGSADGR